MAGFLAAAGFLPAAALCCEGVLAALVSRSLAEVLQQKHETLCTYAAPSTGTITLQLNDSFHMHYGLLLSPY